MSREDDARKIVKHLAGKANSEAAQGLDSVRTYQADLIAALLVEVAALNDSFRKAWHVDGTADDQAALAPAQPPKPGGET